MLLGCQGLLPLFLHAFLGPAPSDHGDTPLLSSLGRQDANITDLYVFTKDDRLVIAIGMNPAIPPGVSTYTFPSDLELRVFLDTDSAVSFDDPQANQVYGGTVMNPGRIHADVSFTIRFRQGRPTLSATGLPNRVWRSLPLFAGLRDDPFIRGPRIGRNVAAVVFEVPLRELRMDAPTLLVWATSDIPGVNGPMADHAGRALRSMFGENAPMNESSPRDQFKRFGMVPDVVIFDTSRPASFPNGRALEDDVVDLVGDPRILANDSPFPSANDVPFLAVFPYLAPPQ